MLKAKMHPKQIRSPPPKKTTIKEQQHNTADETDERYTCIQCVNFTVTLINSNHC
jgi:hypothetical protein